MAMLLSKRSRSNKGKERNWMGQLAKINSAKIPPIVLSSGANCSRPSPSNPFDNVYGEEKQIKCNKCDMAERKEEITNVHEMASLMCNIRVDLLLFLF